MFYFDAVAQSVLFLYLATKWKEIMSFWCKKEKTFLCETYTRSTYRFPLSLQIKLIGVVFFILFLTEHFMFIALQIQVTQQQMEVCNVTDMSFLNNYLRRLRPHLLDVLPYHWWIFPPFQWTITLMAFCWNYVDYFIVILSLGISTRFTQLNERLRHTPRHQMDRKFWLEIRLHYTNLVDLLEYVDDQISLLVLFSMSHNLFLVCTKIFEAVK
jgi:gustatory receptor